jgi:hypothetical protein
MKGALCMTFILGLIKVSFGLILYMAMFVGFIRLLTKFLEKIGLFSFMEKVERALLQYIRVRWQGAHKQDK